MVKYLVEAVDPEGSWGIWETRMKNGEKVVAFARLLSSGQSVLASSQE